VSDRLKTGSLAVKVAPEAIAGDVRDPFVFGFRLGFSCGYDVGYGAAENDMEQNWHALHVGVRAVLRQPTRAELDTRRRPTDDPCRMACGACSRCVRAGWVARHGGDFPGREQVAS
jgi:hypothetical protein